MFPRDFYATGQSYVQRGDILWMIDPHGSFLNYWDMTNNNYVINAIPSILQNIGEYSCLASYQDYLIVIGAKGALPQIYSFTTNSWLTNIPLLNTPWRPQLTCITVNDEIYVIGGETTDNRATVEYLDLSDIANIQNYQWTEMSHTIPQINQSLYLHRTIILCKSIVVIGGIDSGRGYISDITVIDPILKTMTPAGNLNRAMAYMPVVVTDNNIYAFSGTGAVPDWRIIEYHALPESCTAQHPSNAPSISPTQPPSLAPSIAPSNAPSIVPTQPPSIAPSIAPTQPPSFAPSNTPSIAPTQPPSIAPSIAPSNAPINSTKYTFNCTNTTQPPSPPSIAPSIAPSNAPSTAPTQPPSIAPSIAPSNAPSTAPTQPPSIAPSIAPSITPTQPPSMAPSIAPSNAPSIAPTQPPSVAPSNAPSLAPTQP
eukprot:57598_1